MAAATPWDGLLSRRVRPALRPSMPRTVHLTYPAENPPTYPGSKASRVIKLLRENGPMRFDAILLDDELDIPSASHLYGCMKHHINIGRVHVQDGIYSIDEDYEEMLQVEIRAAVKLLRERGYTVEAPKC